MDVNPIQKEQTTKQKSQTNEKLQPNILSGIGVPHLPNKLNTTFRQNRNSITT